MQHIELDVAAHRSQPPPWLYSMTEPSRAAAEVASIASALPWLLNAPRGDGHSVMALPGFMASDLSTRLLRRYLNQHGYRADGWGLGRNLGKPALQQQLAETFLRRSDAAGEPISLVGQSLGGVFARELARAHPDRVRQVITLGSPFGMSEGGSSNPLVQQLFEKSAGVSSDEMRALLLSGDPLDAPPVPCTAIYSRYDGVVAWHTCIERDRTNTDNIEVYGSHVGMAAHPAILLAIADRLAQAQDAWARFDRSRPLRPLLYPAPEFAHG